MPSGFTLTEITIDDSQLRQVLGLPISKRIVSKYVGKLNKLAYLCKDSYQSKVPVDTLELRNVYIDVLKKATSASPSVQIGIVYGTHLGRDRKPMGTLALADVLNLGVLNGRTLHRTQTSHSVGSFSSIPKGEETRNWIKKSRLAFASVKRTYLSGSRF